LKIVFGSAEEHKQFENLHLDFSHKRDKNSKEQDVFFSAVFDQQ